MGMTIDEFDEYAKAHDCVIFTRQQYEHVIDVFNDYELLLLDYYGRLKVDMVAMLEAIDLQFDEICFCRKGEWKTVPEIKAEYKAVIQEKINELPSVTPQEPRWIPVSERLPEDHKDVLAYLSSGRISICRYNSHKLPFCNNPIGWGYLHENGFIDFKKEHVIAWMPLPEPYEPQESEGEEHKHE